MQASGLVKGKTMPSSERVADSGYRAATWPTRYVQGVMNWVMAPSVRFAPRHVVALMVQHLSKPSRRTAAD